jgi:DNA (cytosine-5)-methyltransferase 1
MNYVDVFAGASALSEGFRRSGFSPVAYVEKNKDACNTIKTRVAYHHLKSAEKEEIYFDYISGKFESREKFYAEVNENLDDLVINKEITDTSIPQIFDLIKSNLKVQGEEKIDLLIGGPPCQAYSLVGRHRDSMITDKRNFLYVQYGKFLKELDPTAFVFENVPGLLSAKRGIHFENLEKYFDKCGYKTRYKILDSSNYGVIQSRKRVIIVGWKKEYDLGFPDVKTIPMKWTVRDLFDDLIELSPGDTHMTAEYAGKSNSYLNDFEIRNGVDFVTHNIARPHTPNDREIYKIAIEKWNKERIRLKYDELPDHLITHNNTSAFLDRYKVVDPDGLSHTMVAHIAKDGHYYIHPDSRQCRSLSVREAARIQSFPDDFYFEGSRTAAFIQIGNAVPPLMAHAIAQKMKTLLCQIS